MSRIFRVLILVYAIALLIQAAGSLMAGGNLTSDIGVFVAFSGSTPVAYLVLALGYLFSRNEERDPPLPWLAAVVGLMMAPWIGLLLTGPDPEDLRLFLAALGMLVVFAVAMAWVYLATRKTTSASPPAVCYAFILSAWIAGAGLVLSSLFLEITDGGTGWEVLLRREPWITYVYNVARTANGPSIDWLRPAYGSAGYIVYLLSLMATLAMVFWLSVFRVSFRLLGPSRLFARFAAVFTFAVFWVYTDIFWGWKYLGGQSLWSSYLGTALWLVAPLFVLVLLIPMTLKQGEIWRLQTILLLQLPVAAFNYSMMPDYFGKAALVHLPGLGLLMIGLQLESLACLGMMMLPVPEPASGACERPAQVRE